MRRTRFCSGWTRRAPDPPLFQYFENRPAKRRLLRIVDVDPVDVANKPVTKPRRASDRNDHVADERDGMLMAELHSPHSFAACSAPRDCSISIVQIRNSIAWPLALVLRLFPVGSTVPVMIGFEVRVTEAAIACRS